MDANEQQSSSQQVPHLSSPDQHDLVPTVSINKAAARRRKLVQYIKYLHHQDRFWDRALRTSQDAWTQLSEVSRQTTAHQVNQIETGSVLQARSNVNRVHPQLTEQHYLHRLDEGYNFLMFYLDKCEESVNHILVNAESRLRTCG
jgi:hypothetical protein